MKAKVLLRLLTSQPLGYVVVKQVGSHRRLEAEGRPPLYFSFHDRTEIGGTMIRKILVDQVGLDEHVAKGILGT